MKILRLNYIKQPIALILLSLIGICGHGWADLASQVQLSQAKAHVRCPAIRQLKINAQTKIWTAPGGWKAYDQSFGKKIKRFIGAQWSGVKLGQMICIYHPLGNFTFPVFLYYNKQVIQPKPSQAWKKVKKNRFNCVSQDIGACVFSPLLAQKQRNPDDLAGQIKPGSAFKLKDSNL